jgi:hypothetical protein
MFPAAAATVTAPAPTDIIVTLYPDPAVTAEGIVNVATPPQFALMRHLPRSIVPVAVTVVNPSLIPPAKVAAPVKDDVDVTEAVPVTERFPPIVPFPVVVMEAGASEPAMVKLPSPPRAVFEAATMAKLPLWV